MKIPDVFPFLLSWCLHFMPLLGFEITQNTTTIELNSAIQDHLLSLRNSNWGWNFGNTPRSVIALALANETFFASGDEKSTLIKKQLQLEIALSLAKNHRETISAGQFALYINALLAICQDPHDFFEFNLIRKMKHVEVKSNFEEALKALTLCNAGQNLHKHDILFLSNLLNNNTVSQHNLDTQAMAIMALACNSRLNPNTIYFLKSMLREPVELIKSQQEMDGSFGNIYTTTLIFQAFISSGDIVKKLNFDQAIRYIKAQYETDDHSNVLSYFFVLPVLNFKSMESIGRINCSSSSESVSKKSKTSSVSPTTINNDVWEIGTEYRVSMNAVTYSIKCDVCSFQNSTLSTVVMIQDGKSLLHVVENVALSDNRFHYSVKNFTNGVFVQSLAGIENGIHSNRYWMVYQQESFNKYKLLDKSISMIQPKDNEHYVFWYKQI